MEAIKTIEVNGIVGKIYQDSDNVGPRDWDNLGTMICHHSRYTLGDENHGLDFSDCNSWDDRIKVIRKAFGKDCVMLPIYIYDHSGQTVSTTPFSCRWDSGRVGTIVASRKQIRENFGIKRVNKEKLEHTLQILKGEVETFDQYLQGEVYGYQILKGEEELDSCWGYYGLDYIEETVNGIVEAESKNQCSHITGLATLEEDDEFVIVEDCDDIDFEAGGNMKFNFCPKCGTKF